MKPRLYSSIRQKVKDFGGLIYALNGMPDHVHLVACIPASISVSTFVGQIKEVCA